MGATEAGGGATRAGYLTDIQYTANFAPFLTPAALAYTAVLNGHASPDFNAPFRYCELGCGRGVTSLVLAAVHAHGEFHACDINPAHIEHAAALQKAAGITNLQLHARSIEQMLADDDLPRFDFIVAHGLYSWVPDAVRAQMRAFIAARLAPGGLLFVSYNTLPGWAALQPLRQMLRSYAAHAPGDTLAKAKAAFAYAQRMADRGAGVFKASPAARAQLAEIAQHDIRYVVHEYLTPHGDPFWFGDVERALRDSGVAYAGSLTPSLNVPELMVPPALADPIAATSRTMFEMHHDFVANTAFRRDLYIRAAPRPLPAEVPLADFAPFDFALARLPEQLPLKSADGELQFDLTGRAAAVRAVHTLLASAPADASAIARTSGLSDGDATLLIQQLVIAQHLMPVPRLRPAGGWPALNAALIDAALRERQPSVPLACPALAGALPFEVVQAVMVEAVAANPVAASAASAAVARLASAGHPVLLEGPGGQRRAATEPELLQAMTAAAHRLLDATCAERRLLEQLGLLG